LTRFLKLCGRYQSWF